ncbi:tetratricopeptide repeat protein [Novosphingobium colocasiae]|uniref:tetratricopeptide repeat protein n=1 Tax=Novosphingobium colocasiae TaxID=1256513 RepID=UPI001671DA80|nr:tetratricopeptide repeat protein [Novosphingobium colocasiae]
MSVAFAWLRQARAVSALLLLLGTGVADSAYSQTPANEDLRVTKADMLAMNDEAAAAVLYSAACEDNVAKACTGLGQIYLDPIDLTQDTKKGMIYLNRGCAGGDGGACFDLARAFHKGKYGQQRDESKVLRYLSEGCDKGDGLSCATLGEAYDTGEGVARDRERSLQYYGRACRAQIPLGCERAGIAALVNSPATASINSPALTTSQATSSRIASAPLPPKLMQPQPVPGGQSYSPPAVSQAAPVRQPSNRAPQSDGRFATAGASLSEPPPTMTRMKNLAAQGLSGFRVVTATGRELNFNRVITTQVPDPFRRLSEDIARRYASEAIPDYYIREPMIVGFVKPLVNAGVHQPVLPYKVDRIVRVSYGNTSRDFIEVAFSGNVLTCFYTSDFSVCDNNAPPSVAEGNRRKFNRAAGIGEAVGTAGWYPTEDCGNGRRASSTVGC